MRPRESRCCNNFRYSPLTDGSAPGRCLSQYARRALVDLSFIPCSLQNALKSARDTSRISSNVSNSSSSNRLATLAGSLTPACCMCHSMLWPASAACGHTPQSHATGFFSCKTRRHSRLPGTAPETPTWGATPTACASWRGACEADVDADQMPVVARRGTGTATAPSPTECAGRKASAPNCWFPAGKFPTSGTIPYKSGTRFPTQVTNVCGFGFGKETQAQGHNANTAGRDCLAITHTTHLSSRGSRRSGGKGEAPRCFSARSQRVFFPAVEYAGNPHAGFGLNNESKNMPPANSPQGCRCREACRHCGCCQAKASRPTAAASYSRDRLLLLPCSSPPVVCVL